MTPLGSALPTRSFAVTCILDSLPIVKGKEKTKDGDYRTKDIILEIYDTLTGAIRTGHPYQTRLDPPPADRRVARESRNGEGMR